VAGGGALAHEHKAAERARGVADAGIEREESAAGAALGKVLLRAHESFECGVFLVILGGREEVAPCGGFHDGVIVVLAGIVIDGGVVALDEDRYRHAEGIEPLEQTSSDPSPR